MSGIRVLRLAAVAIGTLGGLSGAAYGLLTQQNKHARLIIGIPKDEPLRADGRYLPDQTAPDHLAQNANSKPITFAMLGDSTGAGVGVAQVAELPGVLLAKGLAAEAERPVLLTTYAISGATSKDLAGQVDNALVDPPDVALIIIGANDVTVRLSIAGSATRLETAVRRLIAAGTSVVVGTCPDLGAIRPIPQPLRSIARNWSLLLARAQRGAVIRAGGTPVPLADLLSPEFLARPAELFSADQFHPNAAGYAEAVKVLLPAVCQAAGVWVGGPLPSPPMRSGIAEAQRPTSKAVVWLNRVLHRVPVPHSPLA